MYHKLECKHVNLAMSRESLCYTVRHNAYLLVGIALARVCYFDLVFYLG